MAHIAGTPHNALEHAIARAGQFLARVPITLFIFGIITLLAIANGSLVHHTDPAIIQRWGISWDNLARHRYLNVPVSDFIVFHREHYLTTIWLIGVYTGLVEWFGGSLLAALTFWLPSWGGTLTTVVLARYLIPVTSWRPDPDLVHTADVGASVGTWGSAGALVFLLYRFRPKLAWILAGGFTSFLVGRFLLHRSTADIAHLFGISFGFLICRAYVARGRLPRAADL